MKRLTTLLVILIACALVALAPATTNAGDLLLSFGTGGALNEEDGNRSYVAGAYAIGDTTFTWAVGGRLELADKGGDTFAATGYELFGAVGLTKTMYARAGVAVTSEGHFRFTPTIGALVFETDSRKIGITTEVLAHTFNRQEVQVLAGAVYNFSPGKK